MAVAHKGSISMGLVLIPISMYKTTTDNDIHFNQLDKESKARIRYKKYCSHCNKEVTSTDIIKGYEYEKDKYVIMTEEEMEKIKNTRDKTIHIIQFFLADKDFVICGYIPKENGVTSLIIGQYRGDELVYKGHVTFGVRTDFATEYNCKILPSSPIKVVPSNNEEAIWLEPKLVGVVQYMPNVKDILRQPVFKGIRDDVSPSQCKE